MKNTHSIIMRGILGQAHYRVGSRLYYEFHHEPMETPKYFYTLDTTSFSIRHCKQFPPDLDNLLVEYAEGILSEKGFG